MIKPIKYHKLSQMIESDRELKKETERRKQLLKSDYSQGKFILKK